MHGHDMKTISPLHRTHVDHPRCITLFEVIQHRRLTEVGHHGHVLDLIILGRVHGEDFSVFDSESLSERQKRHRNKMSYQQAFILSCLIHHQVLKSLLLITNYKLKFLEIHLDILF